MQGHLWPIYVTAPKIEAKVFYNIVSELIYHCLGNKKMHTDKLWYKTRGGFIKMRNSGSRVPGASVRNSAHGKGHEEGGSAYAKAGSSLRSSPGNSRASTPKTRVCLLYCFVLSPPYMTTGKTIALTIRTFVGKVMSLLFNMLSSFVIAFLPRIGID